MARKARRENGDRWTLNVPGQKDFNKTYGLMGSRGEAVVALFGDEQIDLLMEESDLTLEVFDGALLVYRSHQYARPNDLENELDTCCRMAKLLRQGGAE